SARWTPRLVGTSAWTSSTITARTARRISRPRGEVTTRYSDSGVVTRIRGGRRCIAARSRVVVSPVRTSTRMSAGGRPPSARGLVEPGQWLAQVALDIGGQRLQRRDVDQLHPLVWRWGLDHAREEGVKGGQRLTRAGRGHDERVAAGGDDRPGEHLRPRRLAE